MPVRGGIRLSKREGELTPVSVNRSANTLFLYCFIAYALSYLGRQNFSACLPSMMAEGVLDKTWGGYITTAYMMVYAAGQFVNGVSGTRIKPQYMIGIGLGGAGIMNLCMGAVSSPVLMLLIWSGNGLFQSMLWAPMIRVFTDRLPKEKQYAAGVNIAPSIPVGTVLAYLLPGILLTFASWRTVFFVMGVILLLACLGWTVGHVYLKKYIDYMEEKCRHERTVQATGNVSPSRPEASLFFVMISAGLLFVLPCLLCLGALKDAVTAWMPTFFAESFGMDGASASLITVIVPAVSVSGAYVSTWINKRFIRNELFTGGLMTAVMTVCMLGVVFLQGHSMMACAAFLAVGISAMWGANTMFLTMLPYHFAKVNLSSAVTGFFNCFTYFSSAAATSVYGILAEYADWQVLTLTWLGIGIFGVISCALAGRVWRKKSERSNGHL